MNMPVFCPDSGSTSSAMPFSTTDTAARDAPRATREPRREPLQLGVGGGRELEDRLHAQLGLQRVEDLGLRRIDIAQRRDLHDRGVGVDVDHQPGQIVALAVDQAVGVGARRTAGPRRAARRARASIRPRRNAASTASSARVHSRTGICERGL